jgi:erythromycin esterase
MNQGKQEMFYMSGGIRGARHASQLAQWSKVFDGIFYIKEMYHCKGIN